MLSILTFYPNQNEENLRSFLPHVGSSYVVLSAVKLQGINSLMFAPSQLPPPDDAIRAVALFLEQNVGNEQVDECLFVDWESISAMSTLEKEFSKLKETQGGIELVEENIAAQDFRLLPYMENLLKICEDLKLSGTDRLFSTNPKILLPKLVKGNKMKMIEAFHSFLKVRQTINSNKFTGVIPIFNSEFFTICF